MNGQQHLTDEQFDDLARDAGAALRRPAPAGGAQSVRAARRRQQQIRATLGGAALVAVVAVGAAIVLRDDPTTTVVVQPDDTIPLVTDPVTSSTVPTPGPTTTPPITTTPVTGPVTNPAEVPAELSAEAAAWRDRQMAGGFAFVDIVDGVGTSARLLVSQRPDPPGGDSAILLDDGRVIELPDEIAATGIRDLYAVDGEPAVLDLAASATGIERITVWQLDPASESWSSTGDLGLGVLPTSSNSPVPVVEVVDDLLLVGVNEYDEAGPNLLVPSPDRRGVVVRPDLSFTPIAMPPDGVPMSWSVVVGSKALALFAPGQGSLGTEPFRQPWAYDPAANEWSEIALPDWFDCGADAFTCDWTSVADIGAIELSAVTDRGVVTRVPDGTVGLYDPATNSWRRMDDAPFDLWMPTTAVVGDRVVVAPWRAFDNDFDTIGVLDVATGAWTTTQVDIPAAIERRFDEWSDVSWDLRTNGSRVMAVPGPSFQQSDEAPIAVYDAVAGLWSAPTADDIVAWRRLATNLAG